MTDNNTDKTLSTEELMEQAKKKMQEAMKVTQAQTEEAATHLSGLFRRGADQLRKAADAAADAIRDDINKRP